MINKFNIRVYGIWTKKNKILVSNENIDGFRMVKFPGGGLEFGESTVNCVIREFKEELNVNAKVIRLIHTSDTVIQSIFKPNEQVIALHYLIECLDEIQVYEIEQQTSSGAINHHRFEWIDLNSKVLNKLTFEMDKQAISKLL
jgi:8-oxo-dGTP diphosphatase